jgi:hypothetical protein
MNIKRNGKRRGARYLYFLDGKNLYYSREPFFNIDLFPGSFAVNWYKCDLDNGSKEKLFCVSETAMILGFVNP